MKPRTANEKEVTMLSALLPAISATQFMWVRKNLFKNEGYLNKGEVFCSCCGHVFRADKGTEKAICPSCGNELAIKKSRKLNINEWKYFTILTTIQGWQVVRTFKVTKQGTKTTAKTADGFYLNDGGIWCRRKTESNMGYEFHEVSQCWYNAKGEEVIMGVGKVCFSCFQYDLWRHEPLSVKKNTDYVFSADKGVYPRIQLLPTLKRNGFKVIDECLPLVIETLLKNNKAETIFKAGYYDLFMSVARGRIDMNTEGYWDAFKICLRNHYTLDGYEDKYSYNSKWQDYFDYIDNLIELGKDIHNAHYVCPTDFKQAKDKAMKQVQKIEEQRRMAAEIEKARQEEDNYKKMHGKYLGLMIVGKGITIRPLQSVEEFLQESKAMHHCVFSNGYYTRPNSLILTARDKNDNRIETIEISLTDFTIIQSRGMFNSQTKSHNKIVKLMKEHMGEVKALAKPKKKSAKKPARARQAA